MSAPPGPVPSAIMREVLGHFVSGIVVITAAGPAGPLGFTCQSFASLSLDPPLVSFAPARTSTTWPRIREIGVFCVNVLAAGHEELSSGFARSGGDKFAGVDWRHGTVRGTAAARGERVDRLHALERVRRGRSHGGGRSGARPGRGAGPATAALLPRPLRTPRGLDRLSSPARARMTMLGAQLA